MISDETIEKIINKLEMEARFAFIPSCKSGITPYGETWDNSTEISYAHGVKEGIRKACEMLKDELRRAENEDSM